MNFQLDNYSLIAMLKTCHDSFFINKPEQPFPTRMITKVAERVLG